MTRLLDLPAELLLTIYGTLESIQDAARLAQCCKTLHQIFNHQGNQKRILKSIVTNSNLLLPKNPNKTWLKAHFGADCFWKPTESQLPAKLADTDTREFLTITGVPSVICPLTGWDSTHLKKDEEAGEELYAWDADEIFGRRYPDDDSPPTNFCYFIGEAGCTMAMVDAETGWVLNYDQGGFGMNADGGVIADSVPSLLVLLGTMEMTVARMGEVPSDLSDEAIDKYENIRHVVLVALREIMTEYDGSVEEGSRFWDHMFEMCTEY
ncbi:hypothetical protein CNMCM5878_002028 [Aspergillus fumigatiaffinis]|nr:hypothetical protein CNMCM5878_002028 [Aspergillus fumigatiaffinis]